MSFFSYIELNEIALKNIFFLKVLALAHGPIDEDKYFQQIFIFLVYIILLRIKK